MVSRRAFLGASVLAVLAGLAPFRVRAGEARIIMFTQPGCPYCAAWESEIGPIWPRTAEGRAYPLSRMDRRDPLPQGVTLARGVTITPTFVLLVDGEEAGRVEGYPGEEMFWIFLERMLRQADLPPLEG